MPLWTFRRFIICQVDELFYFLDIFDIFLDPPMDFKPIWIYAYHTLNLRSYNPAGPIPNPFPIKYVCIPLEFGPFHNNYKCRDYVASSLFRIRFCSFCFCSVSETASEERAKVRVMSRSRFPRRRPEKKCQNCFILILNRDTTNCMIRLNNVN